MAYIDGVIIPVPEANKEAYRAHAAKALPLFREYGAVRIVETWGDDVPRGKLTDMWGAVKAEPGEVVVFTWIEWPSKAARDMGWDKLMKDERMRGNKPPFDGKRMIYGGFEVLLDSAAKS